MTRLYKKLQLGRQIQNGKQELPAMLEQAPKYVGDTSSTAFTRLPAEEAASMAS